MHRRAGGLNKYRMKKVGFLEALDALVESDGAYDREAYLFLRDALDHTIKRLKKDQTPADRHVTPVQLLDGIRQYALEEYGPMAPTVLDYWGIRETLDFGRIVFQLVEAGILGKTDTDKLDDFADVYDFDEAFRGPYLPSRRRQVDRSSASPAAAGVSSSHA